MPKPRPDLPGLIRQFLDLETQAKALRQALYLSPDPSKPLPELLARLKEVETELASLDRKPAETGEIQPTKTSLIIPGDESQNPDETPAEPPSGGSTIKRGKGKGTSPPRTKGAKKSPAGRATSLENLETDYVIDDEGIEFPDFARAIDFHPPKFHGFDKVRWPDFETLGKPRKDRPTVGDVVRGIGKAAEPITLALGKPAPESTNRGPDSTGLEATYRVRLDPVPTGVYHLLDPLEFPLVEVTVRCEKLKKGRKSARVKVQAYIEGLSANHVRTFELNSEAEMTIGLQPTLFPDKIRFVTEVQRATLHVIVEDLDGATELHHSMTVTILARNSGLNSAVDPITGEKRDLTRYYGAWVTPHVEPVQRILRLAAERTELKTITGYLLPKAENVIDQARALFDTLKLEGKIVYVNSAIDFGARSSYFSQRARLPRETLRQRSANCLDGTLLFASLLEAAMLKPAIVIFRGHTLVAWQNASVVDDEKSTADFLKDWTFLETTWIGSRSFEDALEYGRQQVEREIENPGFKCHKLTELRLAGIFPME